MTKGAFVSLITQRETGGLPDRSKRVKYDRRVVASYMDMARKSLLVDLLVIDGVTDDYIKQFYPFLQWDNQRNFAFANLPASLVQLPSNMGLLFVAGIDPEGIADEQPWDIIDNLSWQVYSKMEVGIASRAPVVYIEGNKVICPALRKDEANRCIRVKIICDSNGYTSNEEYPIPIKADIFMEMVEKLMNRLTMTPAKTSNDGNPNNP
jgi:hypothetical protein